MGGCKESWGYLVIAARKRLKICCSQGRGSSSLPGGTNIINSLEKAPRPRPSPPLGLGGKEVARPSALPAPKSGRSLGRGTYVGRAGSPYLLCGRRGVVARPFHGTQGGQRMSRLFVKRALGAIAFAGFMTVGAAMASGPYDGQWNAHLAWGMSRCGTGDFPVTVTDNKLTGV